MNAGTLEWLLEPSNPSVRFFTLRDILHRSEEDLEVKEARQSIRNYKKVLSIFDKQRPEGYWQDIQQPYLPKYKSTYWQIMILSQLGVDKSDERITKACEYIFQFQLEEGGFTAYTKNGAKRKYLLVEKRFLEHGDQPPPYDAWADESVRENELSCLTGNVAAALLRLGYVDDLRVKRALEWLVEVQNRDGGWLCPYWKAHIKDKHSCFMGTITPLDAFSEVPEEDRTPEMREAIARGAEFLLMHRLFKADHHQFRIINKAWLELSFPCFGYDILRGLSVVTKLGYTNDRRIEDALSLLRQKQSDDGRWILERTPSNMHTTLESKGEPSKWITLHALKVMKRVHGQM